MLLALLELVRVVILVALVLNLKPEDLPNARYMPLELVVLGLYLALHIEPGPR